MRPMNPGTQVSALTALGAAQTVTGSKYLIEHGGVAVVPGTLALLAYEARLAARGLGGMLQVPADPVAVRAADALRAGEA